MTGYLQNIGRAVLGFLAAIGRLSMFTANAVRWTFLPPYYARQFFQQVVDIGYFSLPVVGLTTLFSGMVLALQSYTGFARFSAEDTVADAEEPKAEDVKAEDDKTEEDKKDG